MVSSPLSYDNGPIRATAAENANRLISVGQLGSRGGLGAWGDGGGGGGGGG